MSVPVVFGQRFVVLAAAESVLRHEAVALEVVLADRYVSLVEEGYDLAVHVGVALGAAARVQLGREPLVEALGRR